MLDSSFEVEDIRIKRWAAAAGWRRGLHTRQIVQQIMDGSGTTIITTITIINDLSSLSPTSWFIIIIFIRNFSQGTIQTQSINPGNETVKTWFVSSSRSSCMGLHHCTTIVWDFHSAHAKQSNAIVEQCIEAKSFANVTRLSCSNTNAQSHGTSHYSVTLVQQL